ncbi:hypothetical protein TrLO_g12484 [Triparma laevis f. longispina]|uniref:Tyrosine-protein kinase ephrin type A/B receptor-like domain-containing protein n=1 Tax=Triparma laevis f. longispina TaxID=1714387 RepID=A0A9W7FQX8_9STRA|nr:hypothetical protein TrLO_g12484 [Triparma laevis f. longispina]
MCSLLCLAGKGHPGSGQCFDCASGKFSSEGSTSCSSCSTGLYSGAASLSCSDCAAGTYLTNSATSVEFSAYKICSEGTYSSPASSTCTVCPDACVDCPTGYFCPELNGR